MSAVFQDFSVSISQRRRTCVIDPALALSPFGIPLVRRLAESMELWLPREFWHILDNTHFYLCQPNELNEYDQSNPTPIGQSEGVIIRAIQEWEKIRGDTDPASMKLFWIGDSPGESILPAEIEPSVFWRFETLSRSLDKRLNSENLLTWAFRDAAALSAALSAAVILCQIKGPEPGDSAPMICRALLDWGLESVQADSDDEWLKLERGYYRQHMVSAGLAKLHWSGLRLAVLHIVAPSAASLSYGFDEAIDIYGDGLSDIMDEIGISPALFDYWQGAKAYWYPL
jgi:hypothetical protein